MAEQATEQRSITVDGHTFTKKHHVQFIEDMQEAGFKVREYSGRGMYGEHCPGVTCGRNTEYTKQDVYAATDVALLEDSMGLSVILYAR